jgi:hypothetical protein
MGCWIGLVGMGMLPADLDHAGAQARHQFSLARPGTSTMTSPRATRTVAWLMRVFEQGCGSVCLEASGDGGGPLEARSLDRVAAVEERCQAGVMPIGS